MSRPIDKPLSSVREPTESARIVAAVHVQGDQARVVICDAAAGGAVLDASSLPVSQADQIARLLAEKNVDLLIRVASSATTICRCAPLPESAGADRAALAEALSLIAESDLPSSLPWYRRSAGVVRPGGGGASGPGVGLLVGWPIEAQKMGGPASGGESDLVSLERDEPAVWTSEAAAIAELARMMDSSRLAYADRKSGSLAVFAAGPLRTLIRVLRLAGDDQHAWQEELGAALAETARGVGLEDHPSAAAQDQGLIGDVRAGARLGGALRDATWMAMYGVAFGAAALYADPDPAVRSLVGMSRREPRARVATAQRFFEWVCIPRHAAATIAVCAALLLLIPLGAARARVAVLGARAGGSDKLDQRLGAAEQRVGFYALLRDKRWPMTKLMADVAGAAPVGVELDVLELSQGEGVTIRGTADTSDLVTAFRKNLTDTRIFNQVATPSVGTTSSGVQFQLSARIAQGGAVHQGKPIEDFATKTLAQRLYGDDAKGSYEESPGRFEEPRPSADNRRDRRSEGRGPREGDRQPGGRAERTPSGPSSPPVIPPPLTPEQIAAMDAATAMKEWATRKKAASQPGVDSETRARLTDESERCKQRMQEANKSGGGA